MSKHNYSQYSNKKKPNKNYNDYTTNADTTVSNTKMCFESVTVTDKVIPVSEVKMEIESTIPGIEFVQETVDTVRLPKTVEGVVVDSLKLNVRAEPSVDAEVVCVLDVMSEIKIDVAKSTHDWFKIYTAIGVEGYCMRKFVDAYL